MSNELFRLANVRFDHRQKVFSVGALVAKRIHPVVTRAVGASAMRVIWDDGQHLEVALTRDAFWALLGAARDNMNGGDDREAYQAIYDSLALLLPNLISFGEDGEEG